MGIVACGPGCRGSGSRRSRGSPRPVGATAVALVFVGVHRAVERRDRLGERSRREAFTAVVTAGRRKRVDDCTVVTRRRPSASSVLASSTWSSTSDRGRSSRSTAATRRSMLRTTSRVGPPGAGSHRLVGGLEQCRSAASSAGRRSRHRRVRRRRARSRGRPRRQREQRCRRPARRAATTRQHAAHPPDMTEAIYRRSPAIRGQGRCYRRPMARSRAVVVARRRRPARERRVGLVASAGRAAADRRNRRRHARRRHDRRALRDGARDGPSACLGVDTPETHHPRQAGAVLRARGGGVHARTVARPAGRRSSVDVERRDILRPLARVRPASTARASTTSSCGSGTRACWSSRRTASTRERCSQRESKPAPRTRGLWGACE